MTTVTANEYTLQAPGGKTVPISRELYLAVMSFVDSPDKPSGSITVHYRTGSLVGVDALYKKVYK